MPDHLYRTSRRGRAGRPRRSPAPDHRLLSLGLVEALRAAGLEVAEEYRFHATRAWRLDFALPAHRVGVEIHGGAWTRGPDGQRGGAHHRPGGRRRDMLKVRAAQELGWTVGEFEWEEVPGVVVDWVLAVVRRGGGSMAGKESADESAVV